MHHIRIGTNKRVVTNSSKPQKASARAMGGSVPGIATAMLFHVFLQNDTHGTVENR
jgi:hypothetical protein